MEITNLEVTPQFISRDFQNKVYDFLKENNDDRNILVLNAPTGAGKTYSFKFLEDTDGFSFIVMPNNFLIEEKMEEFGRIIDPKKIGILSSPSINNTLLENGLEKNKDSFLNAIFTSIYNRKIIITNPSFLFLIFYNFYWARVHGKRGGMIQELILRGLRTIIFDEFHVYSPDQRNRIISLNLALFGKLKFIYCSATLPENLEGDLSGLFGRERVITVQVIAGDNTEDLLRGKLNVEIYKATPSEIVTNNLKDLEEGNWCLIVNRIRTISELRDIILSAGIPSEDILTVSGFHDPERVAIRRMIEGDCRIVIASNIIEQGFNPNKKFTNFVIEQGKYDYNFLQRIGRVGRGMIEPSNVKISAESYFEFPSIFAVSFEEFTKRMTFNMKRDHYKFFPYRIGFYLAAFLHFTNSDVQSTIYENLGSLICFPTLMKCKVEFSRITELMEGLTCRRIEYIKNGISPPETKLMPEWWMRFIGSFSQFIRSDEKIDITDLTSIGKENSILKAELTRYGGIWARKNLQGSPSDDGKFLSKGFRKEVFKDFEVEVCGIPWKCIQVPLRDVEWQESDIIKDCIKKRLSGSAFSKGQLKEKAEALKHFVEMTAFPDRLDMRVVED